MIFRQKRENSTSLHHKLQALNPNVEAVVFELGLFFKRVFIDGVA